LISYTTQQNKIFKDCASNIGGFNKTLEEAPDVKISTPFASSWEKEVIVSAVYWDI
jgi:hypothetical protein